MAAGHCRTHTEGLILAVIQHASLGLQPSTVDASSFLELK